MDRDQRREALGRLRRLCVKQPVISVFGGEPTLTPGLLLEAVSDAASLGYLVNVVTNGSGLSPDLIRRLGSAGLYYLAISVDCDDDTEKSDLQQALDLHKVAKRQGIIPVVNAVVTRRTSPVAMKRLVTSVINAGYLFSPLMCSPEIPGGSFSGAQPDSIPTAQQLRGIIPWLAWRKLTTGRVTSSFGYLWAMYRSGSSDSRGARLWHCSSHLRPWPGTRGRGYMTLDSDGWVGSCQEFPRSVNLLEIPETRLSVRFLDDLFIEAVRRCPGCFHNCYVMEEDIRGLRALAEMSTFIQIAAIVSANRRSSGFAPNRTAETSLP